ncbi:MAG: hypothetical protein ACLUFA_06975 [[Clostridium] leptum]
MSVYGCGKNRPKTMRAKKVSEFFELNKRPIFFELLMILTAISFIWSGTEAGGAFYLPPPDYEAGRQCAPTAGGR